MENQPLFFEGNPDPGISDAVAAFRLSWHFDHNFSPLGALKGVSRQVIKNLS